MVVVCVFALSLAVHAGIKAPALDEMLDFDALR